MNVRIRIGILLLVPCYGAWMMYDTCVAASFDERDATLVLTGLKDSRDRLRTGVFRIRGRTVERDPQYGQLEGEVKILCAFDHDDARLRFDRVMPVFDLSNERRGSLTSYETKHIRTPMAVVNWFSDNPHRVAISAPGKLRAAGSPFDVRILGIASLGDINSGTSFESIYASLTKFAPTRYADDGSLCELTWILDLRTADGTVPLKRMIWFDRKRGYSPVRFEQTISRTKALPQWPEPQIVGDASWIQVSDIWVPENVSLVERDAVGIKSELTYLFEWESVNKGVSDELFSYESFELKDLAGVVDNRLGNPIHVDTIGDRKMKIATVPNSGRGTIMIVAIGVSLIVCAIVVFLYRRRVKAGK